MPRYCFLKRSKDSAALRVASLGEEVSRLILAKNSSKADHDGSPAQSKVWWVPADHYFYSDQ